MKLTIEQQRQKNQIDQPIAEIDESDSDREIEAKKNEQQQFKAAY